MIVNLIFAIVWQWFHNKNNTIKKENTFILNTDNTIGMGWALHPNTNLQTRNCHLDTEHNTHHHNFILAHHLFSPIVCVCVYRFGVDFNCRVIQWICMTFDWWSYIHSKSGKSLLRGAPLVISAKRWFTIRQHIKFTP